MIADFWRIWVWGSLSAVMVAVLESMEKVRSLPRISEKTYANKAILGRLEEVSNPVLRLCHIPINIQGFLETVTSASYQKGDRN